MNDGRVESAKPRFFHEEFQKTVLKPPRAPVDHMAISGNTRLGSKNGLHREAWNYTILNNKSNDLASYLIEKSEFRPGKIIIATYLGRTIDTVMANIAIHKAGAGFLNLNTLKDVNKEIQYFIDCLTQPGEDITTRTSPYTIECLLTTTDLWKGIKEELDRQKIRINIKNIVFLDKPDELSETENAEINGTAHHYQTDDIHMDMIREFEQHDIHPDTIAYIKPSSGTTGKPKVIIIRHRGVMARIESEKELFSEAGPEFEYSKENLEKERVIQLIDHSVDASFNEMILALAYGGRLDVVDDETVRDIGKLWEFFKANEISTTILVPSVWKKLTDHALLIGEGPETLIHLKRIFTTGAAANIPLIEEWLNVKFPRIGINAYGPTETTFGLSLELLKQGKISESKFKYLERTVIAIGKPMRGTKLLIVERQDDAPKDCPKKFIIRASINTKGEIDPPDDCVGELIAIDEVSELAAISPGYSNNIEKNKIAFTKIDRHGNTPLSDDFDEGSSKPAYRTGDKVYVKNGKIAALGRYDRQIKINGRPPIDLVEIEILLKEAICHVLAFTDDKDKEKVEAKVFFRHAEYLSLESQQGKVDDDHLVTFIKIEKEGVLLDDPHLRRIYEYMYNKLGSNNGIPSRWCTRCVFEDNDPSMWKDSKKFKEKIWNTQLEIVSQDKDKSVEGFRVLGQCSPESVVKGKVGNEVFRIWKELLFPEIDLKIGEDADFEMLGGNSVLASEVLARLSASYGNIDINPAEFYKTKTLGSLVRDVNASLVNNNIKLALKVTKESIRPIEGLPVYLIPPPMGTEKDSYDNLRRLVGDRYAIGLQTPGEVDERLQSTDFTSTARCHVRSVLNKEHKAYQPYILFGYSSAGIEAIETARQLTAENYQAIVILIDAPCPALVQKMSWESYHKYIVETFLGKTLELKKVFKFRDAKFEMSQQFKENLVNVSDDQKKLALVKEVRAFLMGVSDQQGAEASENQKNKLTVSLNHLEAELKYKIPENINFPCILITSAEFREFFGEIISYNEVEREAKTDLSERLGWSKQWLTQWSDIKGDSAENPKPILGDSRHFGLVQKPIVKEVAKIALEFIRFAEWRIQALLDISRIEKMSKRLMKVTQGAIKTAYKISAITSGTEYCYEQFRNAVRLQNYNDGSLFPVYFNHAMVNACYQSSDDILKRYFSILSVFDEANSQLATNKVDKKTIKQSMQLQIFVDHVYDIQLLQRFHQRLKDAANTLGGYQVDSVLYTLEPLVYERLQKGSSVLKNDVQSTVPIFTPENLLDMDLMSQLSLKGPEASGTYEVNDSTLLEQYVNYRFLLLASQDPDYYYPIQDVLVSGAKCYTENFAAFMLEDNAIDPNLFPESIDFALLSTTNVNQQTKWMDSLDKQNILMSEDRFYQSVQFCCVLRNLGSDKKSILQHPIFEQFFKSDAKNIFKNSPKLVKEEIQELIEEFFEPLADRRQKLDFTKYRDRLNPVMKELEQHRFSVFSEWWIKKQILMSICYILGDSKNVTEMKSRYLLKNLKAIHDIAPTEIKNYAGSLMVSILSYHSLPLNVLNVINHKELKGDLAIRGLKQPLSLSCDDREGCLVLEGFRWLNDGEIAVVSNKVFISINFSNAVFKKIKFENCTFKNVNFDDCIFDGCVFKNCEFIECSLDSAKFINKTEIQDNQKSKTFVNCHLAESQFIDASLAEVTFEGCMLYLAQFNESKLSNVLYNGCDVTGIVFIKSKCEVGSGQCTVRLYSYVRKQMSVQQFIGMTGKIELNLLLISPNSLYNFVNDLNKRFVISAKSINLAGENVAHIDAKFVLAMNKLSESSGYLSSQDETNVESGYRRQVQNLRMADDELIAHWILQKYDQFSDRVKESRRNLKEISAKLQPLKARLLELNEDRIEAVAVEVTKTNFMNRVARGTKIFVQKVSTSVKTTIQAKPVVDRETESAALKKEIEGLETELSINNEEVVKRSFKKKLYEDWQSTSENLRKSPLFELVKFRKSAARNHLQLASTIEADQSSLIVMKELENLSRLPDGTCWLYCPSMDGTATASQKTQKIVYVDLLDALTIANCRQCKDVHCECENKDTALREIQLIRVKMSDLEKYSPNSEGARAFSNSVFQLKVDSEIDFAGTLDVKPVAPHPYHSHRSRKTRMPHYSEYQKALGETTYHKGMNELFAMLQHYTRVLLPSSINLREELLDLILRYIEFYPVLMRKGVLDGFLVKDERAFLNIFREAHRHLSHNMVCQSKTVLMAARSYFAKEQYEQCLHFYSEIKLDSVLNEAEVRAEILLAKSRHQGLEGVGAFESHVLSSNGTAQRGQVAIKYAQAFYQTRNYQDRMRLLQSYSLNGVLKKGLIIDSSGKRHDAFDYITNDYLVRLISLKKEDEPKGFYDSMVSIITGDSVDVSTEEQNQTYGGDDQSDLDDSQNGPRSEQGDRPSRFQAMRDRAKEKIKPSIIKYTLHEHRRVVELQPHVGITLKKNKMPYVIVNSASSVGEAVLVRRVDNPATVFIISNLIQRLHGLMPDHQYMKLTRSQTGLLACENSPIVSIPNNTKDIIREMGHYSLTWKLFEICILGIHHDDYRISYAVKKKDIAFSDNEEQYYPAYISMQLHSSHAKIDWGAKCFSLLKDEKINQFALSELKLLDPEEVVFGWLVDNEKFETMVLRSIHRNKGRGKVATWMAAFPGIEMEVFERFQKFRAWILSQPSNSMTYSAIWSAVLSAEYSLPRNLRVERPAVMAERKLAFQNQMRTQLQRRSQLERAMEKGDDVEFNQNIDLLSDHYLLRILSEFDLVKLKLEHFEKLLNKVMADGKTHLSLNNPTQAQIELVQDNPKNENVVSFDISGCTGNRTVDADKLKNVDHIHASNCGDIEVKCSNGNVNLQIEETSVTKFTGPVAARAKIKDSLAPNAVFVSTDSIQTVIKEAKEAEKRSDSEDASSLAKIALEMQPSASELEDLNAIISRNPQDGDVLELMAQAIQGNHLEEVDQLCAAHPKVLEKTTGTLIMDSLLIALTSGHTKMVVHVLTKGVKAWPNFLFEAVECDATDVVEQILKIHDSMIDHINTQGHSALCLAVQHQREAVIDVLLEAGASVSKALITAIESNARESIFAKLLNKATPEDINDTFTNDGKTLLIYAAENGKFELVSQLIKRGADIDRSCLDGSKTTLQGVLAIAYTTSDPVSCIKIQELFEVIDKIAYKKPASRSDAKKNSGLHVVNQDQVEVEVDVPGYGSCLFWSAALGYLLPVRKDLTEFNRRFELLFGKQAEKHRLHFHKLILEYHPGNNTRALYNDHLVNNLVCTEFRKLVVNYMVAHRQEFQNYTADEFGTTYDQYIASMYQHNTWAGQLEIRAIQSILNCNILTFADNVPTQYPDQFRVQPDIILVHVNIDGIVGAKRNHYHFRTSQDVYKIEPPIKAPGEPAVIAEPPVTAAATPPVALAVNPPVKPPVKFTVESSKPGEATVAIPLSCVSGNGKILAILSDESLNIRHCETGETLHSISKRAMPNILQISMDDSGECLLLFSYAQLMVISCRTKTQAWTSASVLNDTGFRGATLSSDGNQLLYCINEEQEMPYRVLKIESLVGSDDLIEIAQKYDGENPSIPDVKEGIVQSQIAYSDDNLYFVVVEPGVGIKLCDFETPYYYEGMIEEQVPILRIQLQKFETNYRLSWLTEAEFNMVDITPSVGNDATRKMTYEPYFQFIDEEHITKDIPSSGKTVSKGGRLLDFTLDIMGKGLIILDNAKTVHAIQFDDRCYQETLHTFRYVLLSRSGYVVAVSENEVKRFKMGDDKFEIAAMSSTQKQTSSPTTKRHSNGDIKVGFFARDKANTELPRAAMQSEQPSVAIQKLPIVPYSQSGSPAEKFFYALIERLLSNTHVTPESWASEGEVLAFVKSMLKNDSKCSVSDQVWHVREALGSDKIYYQQTTFPLISYVKDFILGKKKRMFVLPVMITSHHFVSVVIERMSADAFWPVTIHYANPTSSADQMTAEDKEMESTVITLIEEKLKPLLNEINSTTSESFIFTKGNELSRAEIQEIQRLYALQESGVKAYTLQNHSCLQQINGSDCGYIVGQNCVDMTAGDVLSIPAFNPEFPESSAIAIGDVRERFFTQLEEKQKQPYGRRQWISRLSRALTMNQAYCRPLCEYIKSHEALKDIDPVLYQEVLQVVKRMDIPKGLSTIPGNTLEDQVLNYLLAPDGLLLTQNVSVNEIKKLCDRLLEPVFLAAGDVIFQLNKNTIDQKSPSKPVVHTLPQEKSVDAPMEGKSSQKNTSPMFQPASLSLSQRPIL